MPKLTETTNDKLKNGMMGSVPIPPMPKIVAPHEPLNGEPLPLNIPTAKPEAPKQGVAPVTQELKVALVGTAPSSRHLAPYGDPTWQIWACSAGNMDQVPRVDAWFEIHASLLWPENQHYGKPYVEWLNRQTFPVYMLDNSMVSRATPLPIRELIDEFGPYFFTSSFAWMLAMAMKKGAKEIAMYGIDMASRDEYILQRPGAYYFFMEAKRRGIKITAPFESDIMQPPGLYGFSDGTPFGRKIAAREKELKDRLAGMRQQRDQLNNSILYLEGALEDVDYMRNIWGGVAT